MSGRAHECVFVEEQEPSGRLILGPCLTCGLSAMDALEQLRSAPTELAPLVDRSQFVLVSHLREAVGTCRDPFHPACALEALENVHALLTAVDVAEGTKP